MKKAKIIILLVSLVVLTSGSLLIALNNNYDSKKITTQRGQNLEKSTSVGFILLKRDGKNSSYVFVEKDTGKEHHILVNRKMITSNIRSYLNIVVKMTYKYNVNNITNKDGEKDVIYLIREIENIDIIYKNIEITGYLSLRGSPPKLILTTEDNDENISYEFDKKQSNYKEIVENYQSYSVKIIGKYFSRIFENRDSSKSERRYLIVNKIKAL